jgi:hypothetical protein
MCKDIRPHYSTCGCPGGYHIIGCWYQDINECPPPACPYYELIERRIGGRRPDHYRLNEERRSILRTERRRRAQQRLDKSSRIVTLWTATSRQEGPTCWLNRNHCFQTFCNAMRMSVISSRLRPLIILVWEWDKWNSVINPVICESDQDSLSKKDE